MTSETKEQSNAVAFLEAQGYVVVRVVAASKSGVCDLVACAPSGRFVAIEMKKATGGVTSVLQKVFLAKVAKNKGVAIKADGYSDLKEQLAISP